MASPAGPLVLLSLLLPAIPPAGAASPWTLDQAVAVAVEHSPDARIARSRIEGAQALESQASAAWMPQLSVSGNYTDTNSPMAAFGAILNERAFSFGLDFNRPGRIDDLQGAGTLAYNLYSGGRSIAARDAARAGQEAANEEWQEARQQLAADVVRAGLDLRKVREATGAVEAGVRAYESAVAVAQARYDAGQLLKADLLSLKVQLAQTRAARSQARHAASLASRAFEFLLGVEPSGRPVELAADDPSLADLAVPATGDFSRRPELAALQARVRAAEAMVDSARGGHRPSVDAFASYQYDQGWVLDRHADGWVAGLAVNLDVFDGGLTSGRVRQARANLDQTREMLRKATLAAGLEVDEARLAHADAVERLSVTADAVAQAEESASLTRARFEKADLMTADLIGAESRLIEARLRRTEAWADERIALVELRRSLGLDPLPSPAPAP